MAVQSFYCALCGIKLSPEQARSGRSSVESMTTYCSTCADNNGIALVLDAPPFPATTSGRFRSLQPEGSGRGFPSPGRSAPDEPGPTPRLGNQRARGPDSPRAGSSRSSHPSSGGSSRGSSSAAEGAPVSKDILASILPAHPERSAAEGRAESKGPAEPAPAPLAGWPSPAGASQPYVPPPFATAPLQGALAASAVPEPIVIAPPPRRVIVVERPPASRSQAPLTVALSAVVVLVATIFIMKSQNGGASPEGTRADSASTSTSSGASAERSGASASSAASSSGASAAAASTGRTSAASTPASTGSSAPPVAAPAPPPARASAAAASVAAPPPPPPPRPTEPEPRPSPPPAAPPAGSSAGSTGSAATEPEGPFLAHRTTKKFHLQTCRFGQQMAERNRVTLPTLEEARKLGYAPCQECLKQLGKK